MTINKLSEQELTATPQLDSKSVSHYLSENPEFFDQHPELLDNLNVPHTERGSAISLVERQVQNLRKNNKKLDQQLQELLDVARENDRLADRLHRFTLTLLDCNDREEIFSAIEIGLKEEFGIDQVIARLNDRSGTKYSVDPELLDSLFPPESTAAPVCFSDPGKGHFQELFDLQSHEINSSAVLPLGGQQVNGLLALGSSEEQRFQPGMSTVYLTRLAEIINGVLVACKQEKN